MEYKFGDYDTKTLYASGANEVVAWIERLTPSRISQLLGMRIDINLCFGGFSDEICPLAPESKVRLEKLITQAIQLSPQGIIIDHFRFGGHWEKSLTDNLYIICWFSWDGAVEKEKTAIIGRLFSEI